MGVCASCKLKLLPKRDQWSKMMRKCDIKSCFRSQIGVTNVSFRLILSEAPKKARQKRRFWSFPEAPKKATKTARFFVAGLGGEEGGRQTSLQIKFVDNSDISLACGDGAARGPLAVCCRGVIPPTPHHFVITSVYWRFISETTVRLRPATSTPRSRGL